MTNASDLFPTADAVEAELLRRDLETFGMCFFNPRTKRRVDPTRVVIDPRTGQLDLANDENEQLTH